MGRRIRIQKKKAVYFVTNRCFQAQFLLRPSKRVNAIILGLLAKYAEEYDIEIFGFVFMSNHFHLLLRARKLNLSRFMGVFQSVLTRELNRLFDRDDTIFPRRFTSPEVLDDESMWEKMHYMMNNPCLSNLVDHPDKWPGISSWQIHKSGEPMVGRVLNREKLRRLRRKDPNTHVSEAYDFYVLDTTPLPLQEGLERSEQDQRLVDMVEERAEELQRQRKEAGIPCVGAEAIKSQHWSHTPDSPKKSNCPLCICADPITRKEHRKAYRATLDRYRKAMSRYRANKANPGFPPGTIPPGQVVCVAA